MNDCEFHGIGISEGILYCSDHDISKLWDGIDYICKKITLEYEEDKESKEIQKAIVAMECFKNGM